MRELATELVKLSALKPDERNARLHDERNIEEIKRSLVDNEQYAPLIVQRSTGKIIAGNGRYTAMRELGWAECNVCYIDCTDEEATKIALTDNRTSELAEWDFATLKDLMQELGPEPDVAGWTDEEIEDMFQVPDFQAIDDEDIGDAATLKDKLVFGKYTIFLTKEEQEELESRLKEYVETNGTTFGFVTELLQ